MENQTEYTSKIETITPERAADILANHNPGNRPLARARVRSYAQEMAEHRWRLSPQGISFDGQGNLVDGQHRLAAIKQSGQPQQLYVTRNVDKEAARVMDQGLARTAAQIAAQELVLESGMPTSRLTSAARAVLELGKGVQKPSNSAIVDFAGLHAPVIERYSMLGKQHTAGVHGAFVTAELAGMKGVREAARRLEELKWEGDDDPMRALALSLGSMGGRDGAKAKATRFHTTLAALEYIDRGEPLKVARKYEEMPSRVRESVRVDEIAVQA